MLWIHELFPLSADREFPRDSPYPIAILNICSQKLPTHILMLEDGFCCQYTSSHSNAFSGLLSDAAFAQESSPLCFHKVATPYAQPLLVMLDQTCLAQNFNFSWGGDLLNVMSEKAY